MANESCFSLFTEDCNPQHPVHADTDLSESLGVQSCLKLRWRGDILKNWWKAVEQSLSPFFPGWSSSSHRYLASSIQKGQFSRDQSHVDYNSVSPSTERSRRGRCLETGRQDVSYFASFTFLQFLSQLLVFFFPPTEVTQNKNTLRLTEPFHSMLLHSSKVQRHAAQQPLCRRGVSPWQVIASNPGQGPDQDSICGGTFIDFKEAEAVGVPTLVPTAPFHTRHRKAQITISSCSKSFHLYLVD